MSYSLRLSRGTHVVDGQGRVGPVVASLDRNRYRVRFVDGAEPELDRDDVDLQKHVSRSNVDLLDPLDIEAIVDRGHIFLALVGSRAFGLETDSSDHDRRGIFVVPAALQWSLHPMPQSRATTPEDVFRKLEHCSSSPSSPTPMWLEALHSPHVEFGDSTGAALLEIRSAFLSRLAYQTYNGYVLSPFRRIVADLRTTGAPCWKHVMHLLRPLISGISLVEAGYLELHVGERRDRLLSVRRGEVAWTEIEEWRHQLHREFDAAVERSILPPYPDVERVNGFLIEVRRQRSRDDR